MFIVPRESATPLVSIHSHLCLSNMIQIQIQIQIHIQMFIFPRECVTPLVSIHSHLCLSNIAARCSPTMDGTLFAIKRKVERDTKIGLSFLPRFQKNRLQLWNVESNFRPQFMPAKRCFMQNNPKTTNSVDRRKTLDLLWLV